MEQVDALVRTQVGVDPDTFRHKEYFLPTSQEGQTSSYPDKYGEFRAMGNWAGCKWEGIANIGCQATADAPENGKCWSVLRTNSMMTRAHELGHNLGLGHAGECPDVGEECERAKKEYGAT